MTYQEACQYLGREPAQRPPMGGGRPPGKPAWEPRDCAAPGDLWKAKARRLVDDAIYHLWSPPGQAMVGFLSEEKGLNPGTIKASSLGWLPGDRWDAAPAWGQAEVLKDNGKPKKFWLPKGITIPLCQDGQVVRVRIRRPEGEPRYYLLRGSSTQALLVGTGPVAVLVESELDALLLTQEAGDLAHLVSLGNAQTRPDREAADLLKRTRLILLGLDADQAGAKESWRWWKTHYPQAHRWPPIQGKDPGEMFAAGVNLRAWVQAGLAEYVDAGQGPGGG
jgi:DNA primase